MRKPDFTITYGEKEFYWEHVNGLIESNYKNAWASKQKWYKDNGYFESLIISKVSDEKSIDSVEISNIAKRKILGTETI
jgi:hypothetical protein